MKVQNILIVSTTGMGDCLWATPGIRELKNAYPDAQIDLIVKKDWLDLFKNNPHIEKISSWNVKRKLLVEKTKKKWGKFNQFLLKDSMCRKIIL